VYEEAEAYAYLSGIALSIGTLVFIRRPTVACYAVLAFFAGLAAVVRPTLVFYGFSSVLVAWIHSRRLGWTLRKSFLGVAFFCAGAVLLFGANLERFGSGFEFGYRLHLNDIDYARFATRFGAPYSREPLLSALTELFSSLFLVGDAFNGHAYHRDAFLPGQSGTIRWREFYFTTFDLTLLAMVALAWGWSLRRYWSRRGIKNTSSSLSESGDMAAWSFLGAFGLLFFYLRCPFLASRYLLDFAPAFAVAILALAQVLKEFLRARLQTRFTSRWTFFALFALWYGHQLITAKSDYPANEALTYAELTTLMQRDDPPARPLPAAYSVGMNLADYGISFNGIGWDTATGETKAAIAIFIRDPERLELEVAPVVGTHISGTDYDQIRAKIGLESLKLESIRRTPEGASLLFRGPEKRIYRSGLQVASLGFLAPQELSVSTSRFRLLCVRWRNIDDG